jgi:phosphopantetheinyl transferase
VPIFFQQQINDTTRLGIWKIEETEDFFKSNVPQHRDVTHPHKRLQHLAGRFLLQYLFPAFPYELIQIADTRKPYLPGDEYHFSISHCGDFAAAIVSKDRRVGIDIEIPTDKILKIQEKFLSVDEKKIFNPNSYRDQYSMINDQVGNDSGLTTHNSQLITLLWSAKESVFKWYGNGGVDFRREIQLQKMHEGNETVQCLFSKDNSALDIHYRQFDHLVLAWVVS